MTEPPRDTAAALERLAVARDAAAWAIIVTNYQQNMLWTARVILGTDADAEDAVQEALLLIRDHADRFTLRPDDDRDQQVQRWILRITANCAIDLRRREARHRKRSVSYDQAREVASPPPPQQQAPRELSALQVALAEMDEARRLPIVLHYFLGLDHNSMAHELCCSPATARKRLSRALGTLRARLGRSDPAMSAIAPMPALEGLQALIVSPAAQIPGPPPDKLVDWQGLIHSDLTSSSTIGQTLGGGLGGGLSISLIASGIIAAALIFGSVLLHGRWQSSDTAPLPVMAVAEAPAVALTLPGKPDWAVEAGQDAYGVWADLAIGPFRQRFRRIPAGTFRMGSPRGEEGRNDIYESRRTVTLSSGFWLADTEITQAVWQQVMGVNPSRFTGTKVYDADLGLVVDQTLPDDLIDWGQNPVEQVSWADAQTFIDRLGKDHPGAAISLPTEAQWEYACRAGTTTAFAVGDPRITEWNGREEFPHGVKDRMPNSWGLYGMHDNVSEWLGAEGLEIGVIGAVTDPYMEAPLTDRMTRGGSFNSPPAACASARRLLRYPTATFEVGVRLRISEATPSDLVNTATAPTSVAPTPEDPVGWRVFDARLPAAMAAVVRGDTGPLTAWCTQAGAIRRQMLGVNLHRIYTMPKGRSLVDQRHILAFLEGCPQPTEAIWVYLANQVAYDIAGGSKEPEAADLAQAVRLADGLQAAIEDCGTDIHHLIDTVACVRFRQGDRAAAAGLWLRAITAASNQGDPVPELYRQRLAAARDGHQAPVPSLPTDQPTF